MSNIRECQIPSLPRFSEGPAALDPQSLGNRIKRVVARPWNYHVKKWLKMFTRVRDDFSTKVKTQDSNRINIMSHNPGIGLQAGDWVQVRSHDEIKATLDQWNELKGCAFLEYMWQYCDTTQQVLQPMERFLDERDYKVKKVKGIVLLENVICHGTPVFGRCDRCCHLFWREEWLKGIEVNHIEGLGGQIVD